MYLVPDSVGPLTGTVLTTKLIWLLIIPIRFRCHFSRRLARSREKWRHCVTVDIAPFQVDPVYLSEFKAWRVSQPTSVDITCTFMNHIIKEEVNPCLNFHNSQVIISGTYKRICSATRSQMYMVKFRNSQVLALNQRTSEGTLLIWPVGTNFREVKYKSKFIYFHSRNYIWKCRLGTGALYVSVLTH